MPALGPSDFSYDVTGSFIEGKHKRNQVVITLPTTSTGSYPSAAAGAVAAIPLSTTPGDYGMVRNIDYLIMYDAGTNCASIIWQYLASEHAIAGSSRTTVLAGVLATTWLAANLVTTLVIRCEAVGW